MFFGIIVSLIFIVFFISTFLYIGNRLIATGSHPKIKNEKLNSYLKNNAFQNINGEKVSFSFKDFFKMLSLQFNKPKDIRPKIKLPHYFNINSLSSINENETQIIWFGHSCVLLIIDGKKILLDPSLSENASPLPFGVKRFNTVPEELLTKVDFDIVIYSHDHYDHLDYKTFKKIKQRTKNFVSPLGVAQHLDYWGIEKSNNYELDWWQEIKIEGLKIVCTPSQHFSGRKPSYRNNTLWASFVIIGKNQRAFFSGDGGYGEHFKDIGQKYGPFDLTILETGQYNELWQAIHSMPEQTIKAHIDLQGEYLLPIHWAGFALSVHSWTEPIERVLKEAKKNNVEVLTPKIGELLENFHKFEPNSWWKNI